MQRRVKDGLVTYHFESLGVEGLVHAIFTRLGGASQAPFASLNVGGTVGDDPAAVRENHSRIYKSLSLSRDQVASPHQVHGNRIERVTTDCAGNEFPTTDGLTTDLPGAALMLRFADCQPILLYDPIRHALALVHAGWRGVAQAIVRRAVERMQAEYGTRPVDLLAGLGPTIGQCCYTVGDKVSAALGYVLPDWSQVMVADGDKWRLDISAANAQLLAAAGVERIEESGICTACRIDEFFSHRAENGRTGRFGAVACLEGRSDLSAPPPGASQAELTIELLGENESLNPPGFPSFGESLGGEP